MSKGNTKNDENNSPLPPFSKRGQGGFQVKSISDIAKKARKKGIIGIYKSIKNRIYRSFYNRSLEKNLRNLINAVKLNNIEIESVRERTLGFIESMHIKDTP